MRPPSPCSCSSSSASRPPSSRCSSGCPTAYPNAPSPITAVFAGLLTKVGVYAIIRTQTLLFTEDTRPATLLLVVAAATMVVGVLGAIAQDDIRRILSFTIVSQIGYMVMGLAFFSVAGMAAVVFSMVHHIIIKTALFLIGGLIDHASGSSRLSHIGGMVRTTPLLAAMFLVAALSLAGIPPLSGFVSKFALIEAGIGERDYVVIGREPRGQPAHPLLDGPHLDRRVLEPVRGRDAPAPASRRGAAVRC